MRDLAFSLIHNLAVPAILRRCRVRNREISVLMFHRISNDSDPLWSPMPVESFGRLMKELSEKACVVRLENIDEIKQYPDKPLVALSFDDGYPDFLENAVGILVNFGLPAHLNVCPGLIDKGVPPWTQILSFFLLHNAGKNLKFPNGKTRQIEDKICESNFIEICNELYAVDDKTRTRWIDSLAKEIPELKLPRLMGWDQIKECARLGIHIGSHGLNHRNMNKIEDEDLLREEIDESKRRIHEEVDTEPLIFAFPSGLYNELSMEIVRKGGYKVALLCDDMITLFTEDHHKKSFYIFPRIGISRSNWKEENLRLLGFHQKLKNLNRRTPYVLPQP